MNVVVVASEAFPFAKTGGLADVIGALPPALARLGHRPVVILPGYRHAWEAGPPPKDTGRTVRVRVGGQEVEGAIVATRLPDSDVPVYLIDQPAYFERDSLYGVDGADYPDNCDRFVFFARAALEAIGRLGLRPEVVHCNDWQTGLIPVYLAEHYRRRPGYEAVGSLLTVHNLAYQGAFPPWSLPLTGLAPHLFNPRQLECYGQLNFLKAGLAYAELISTVSPTYAREIQTPEYGRGLDGLLRHRAADLRGIVNGIDPAVWNPAVDPYLVARYDVATVAAGKARCKAELQRLAGLPQRPEVPLLAQIGRLDAQKGWDLILAIADDLLREDVQIVVLGVGHVCYHQKLGALAGRYLNKLRAFLEFSDEMSHRIEAGADLFLMPSLYEPCGLNQLYSQAYGTVPIVRATGGLADTVVDAEPRSLADGTATGFVFREPSPRALRGAIDRALALWPDRPAWMRLVGAGMQADWSWDRGAREYVGLYEEIHGRRAAWAAV
ncbi:MAG TPA: glycogen synthase GlgA [Isosphaeraceae bacterium]